MKKLKIYLDTSVISFVYADDSPEKQAITQEFFDDYLSKYDIFISNMVLTEINHTQDPALKERLKQIIKKYDLNIAKISEKDQESIFGLAQKYVKERIIPKKKFNDAIHIAICVYYEFDILLSWNFRHLANINKQIQVNIVNRKEGYLKELFLLNPMEVIYENT